MNTQAFIPSGPREVSGVLLAGGKSRRFGGGDKCLQTLDGKTLLERAALNAAPQVGALMLNINGEAERFPDLGLPILCDSIEGHAGPLAGVLSAMECVASHAPQSRWIATFATDAPFIPVNWVARVRAAITRERADLGTVSSNGRTHPVFGLWPVDLRFDLRKAMEEEGLRKVDEWTGRYNVATVDFEANDKDPFFNINTAEDLSQAATLV
ncbi:MAG: molybdenum cofactor guanylyltransferase MobA [Magnetovibrio sp.]|nr:molybdenum cofactor guanylyltransferase MobA [Magnetovibrio sp.]